MLAKYLFQLGSVLYCFFVLSFLLASLQDLYRVRDIFEEEYPVNIHRDVVLAIGEVLQSRSCCVYVALVRASLLLELTMAIGIDNSFIVVRVPQHGFLSFLRWTSDKDVAL